MAACVKRLLLGVALDTGDCEFGFDAQSGGLMDLATAGVIGPRGPADSEGPWRPYRPTAAGTPDRSGVQGKRSEIAAFLLAPD